MSVAANDHDTTTTTTNVLENESDTMSTKLYDAAKAEAATVELKELERQISLSKSQASLGDVEQGSIERTNSSFMPQPKVPMRLAFGEVCTYVPAQFEEPGVLNSLKKAGKAVRSAFSSEVARAPERQILHNITGVVNPGEVVAIMGPSGSGKTTFISLLAGRNGLRTTGTILYNDQHKPTDKTFKRQLGYVSQEDVLFEGLTVFETLYYTAVLRLPRAMTDAEKRERVDVILEVLGISHVKDSIVGGVRIGRRGISGGEKKRVAIGQELLYNPSVILLDEPTSGLDSTTALNLVHTLHDLAQVGNRTIVTTIHQPSSRIYQMLDKLLLMGQGHLLFYGDASAATDYFAEIGYAMPYGMNPADYFLDVASGWSGEAKDCGNMCVGDPELKALLRAIEDKPHVKGELAEVKLANAYPAAEEGVDLVDGDGLKEAEPLGPTYLTQMRVICVRSIKERRFERFNVDSIGTVIFMAVLCGVLWFQAGVGASLATYKGAGDVGALLFFLIAFMSFNLLFNSIFTFPNEKTMLLKERDAKMYPISAFFFARTLADIPMDLAIPIGATTVIYLMVGLKPTVGAFLLTQVVVVITCFTAASLGLLLGAAFLNLKRAQTAATIVMLTLMLTGGFFVQNIPVWLQWLPYLSYMSYGWDALLHIQLAGRVPACPPGEEDCAMLNMGTVKFDTLGPQFGIILLMMVVFRFGVYLSLRWGAKNNR
ncbi:G-family ABC transporter [Chloropicon primus]|uniref:G-family ABC transporter n=1 Tax=Chloropicon primus TaxID=1764295 RepID=A0A5B8MG50_9CHLO|nr:G-family ABC transporter [Chloropicon primus]|eukprot:QDZ19367.1 G-family ABC transporter [Chloropicon primus]